MTKEKKDKDKQVNFYDVFRIGLEIEGEFMKSETQLNRLLEPHNVEVGEDGSVRSMGNGDIFELRSPIIENTADENTFIEAMKSIEQNVELRQRAFAYSNKTAGTHIHFSFNPNFELDYKINDNIEGGKDNLLRAFDSVDFEKFFFKRYFASFKLEKFWDRLQNDYCQPAIPFTHSRGGRLETPQYRLDDVEEMKARKDKYKWLNPAQIMDERGAELRIFPYITTADGVQDIITFAKDVLLAYFNRKGTKDKMAEVEKFYQIMEAYSIDQSNLNMYDQILIKQLRFERNANHLSFDVMAFIVYLFSKKPTAFKKREI